MRRQLAALLVCLTSAMLWAQEPAAQPPNTPPLAATDPAVAEPMRLLQEITAKGSDGEALLTNAALSRLREVTEFRRLVRDRAPVGDVTMVVAGEPGTAMVVRGAVVDAQGTPMVGALVYAYHTDQRGWYSDRAGHFSGDSGDFAHARLFGYVRTDARGEFVLHTIRPGGYPRSTLPEHIHWQVFVGEQSAGIGEVWFDDDPRLTQVMRDRRGRDVVLCTPAKDGNTIVVVPKLVVAAPRQVTPVATVQERLLAAAHRNVYALAFDGQHFSGPGWSLLQAETKEREFVLLGEEHGLAEVPVFARELFLALRPHGFDTLAVEISAPIADDLDRAARDGLAGVEAFLRAWPPGPAFYFWRTEAELVVAARAAVPGPEAVLWGVDYEVTSDRRLIDRLSSKVPAAAQSALSTLQQASLTAWATWQETHDPRAMFLFAGDPALVRAVRTAWPKPDAEVVQILNTLEESLEIHRLFPNRAWESNDRRCRFSRATLVDRLTAARARDGLPHRRPKVLFKLGETHMMRGVTSTGTFDIGTLIAEAAALRGGTSFSIIAGGGKGGRHAVLDPRDMSVVDAPVDMFDGLMNLGFLTEAFAGPTPVLIDLRPLRSIVSAPARLAEYHNAEAVRAIHAFDVMLIWNGCASARLLTKP